MVLDGIALVGFNMAGLMSSLTGTARHQGLRYGRAAPKMTLVYRRLHIHHLKPCRAEVVANICNMHCVSSYWDIHRRFSLAEVPKEPK